MRMLSMLVRNRCVWSGCISVPYAYTQNMHVRNTSFSIIFKVPPKTANKVFIKIAINTYKWSQKLHEKIIFCPNTNLKIKLSIGIRNFAALNEPLNIY